VSVLEIDALVVNAGEIAVLPGEDSTQKTAMLETIMGFRPGKVSLFGQDVSAFAVERRVRLGMGYVPAGRRVFASLTVRENIEAASSLPARERRQRVGEMLALFPMLAERPDARAWLLSGGQQQMLALARAMVDRPRLLLLDQPTTGLATTIANDVRLRLDGLARDGVAIVVAP
jgi:branched-chain amino acid transport system ATP-binding protein